MTKSSKKAGPKATTKTPTAKAAASKTAKLSAKPAKVRSKGAQPALLAGQTPRAIPVSTLHSSEHNVRHDTAPVAIGELKASIKAIGLLSPLCVVQGEKGYGVVAGLRRFAALQELIASGDLPPTHEVDCYILPDASQATLVSLSENLHAPMPPASQLKAFSKLVVQGKSTADIAAAFAVSTRTVQARLQLANVAPAIFALFEAEKVNLDVMEALASIDSQDEQQRLWDSLRAYDRTASSIREHINKRELRGTDPLVQFVTPEAYEAAGGVTRADLFAKGPESKFFDRKLIQKLASELFTKKAAKKLGKKPCAFIEFHGSQSTATYNFPKPPSVRQYTDEQRARLAQLDVDERTVQNDFRTFEREFNAMTEPNDEDLEAAELTHDNAMERIEAERDAIDAATPELLPDECAGLIGAVGHVQHDGTLLVRYPVMRRADYDAFENKQRKAVRNSGPEASDAPAGPRISAALGHRLSSAKTHIARLAVAQSPEIALRMLALHALRVEARDAQMSASIDDDDDAADDDNLYVSRLTLSCQRAVLAKSDDCEAIRCRFAALPSVDLQGQSREAWALSAPIDDVMQVVARFVAGSLDLSSSANAAAALARGEWANPFLARTGFDVRAVWTPTVDSYFGGVSKDVIIEDLRDAGVGEVDLTAIAKSKKAEAAARAADLVADTRWVPALLR